VGKGDLSRHKPSLCFGLFVRGDKVYWGQGEKWKKVHILKILNKVWTFFHFSLPNLLKSVTSKDENHNEVEV
jgi:hypothetical protein